MPPLNLSRWKVATRPFQYLTWVHHIQQNQSEEHRERIKVELELFVSKDHVIAVCAPTKLDETKDNSYLVNQD